MSAWRKRVEEFARLFNLTPEEVEKVLFCGQVIRQGFPSTLPEYGDEKSHPQAGECDNPSDSCNPEENPDIDQKDGGSES